MAKVTNYGREIREKLCLSLKFPYGKLRLRLAGLIAFPRYCDEAPFEEKMTELKQQINQCPEIMVPFIKQCKDLLLIKRSYIYTHNELSQSQVFLGFF